MRRRRPARLITLGALAGALLSGCLPPGNGPRSEIRRVVVVDLRPGGEVVEQDAAGAAELLVAELARGYSLHPLSLRELARESGGPMIPAEEYRETPADDPRLITGADITSAAPQLYLIGELAAFEVREGSADSSLVESGYRRDEALVLLNLRLYLVPTGELLDEARIETLLSATGARRRPPGTPVGDNADFRDSLQGAALVRAIDETLGTLDDTLGGAPWAGRITAVTAEGSVMLPLGYRCGARPGDVFIVYAPREVVDGGSASTRGVRAGSVRLESVGAEESLALPLSGGGFQPGWLVVQEL